LSVSVSAGATVMLSRCGCPWIDVLDRADDDAVVGAVAHDSISYSFPAQHRLSTKHGADRRGAQAAGDDLLELVAVVRRWPPPCGELKEGR